jgi:hypothetical protein
MRYIGIYSMDCSHLGTSLKFSYYIHYINDYDHMLFLTTMCNMYIVEDFLEINKCTYIMTGSTDSSYTLHLWH